MKLGVSATGHRRELRTVIVDDSALARLLLRDALSHIPGIRVVGNASAGHAAIEVVDAVSPDLVTLDIDLPGIDGIEILRELKRRHPLVKVLVCTRSSDLSPDQLDAARAAGALDVIDKPSSRNRDANVRRLSDEIANRLGHWLDQQPEVKSIDAPNGLATSVTHSSEPVLHRENPDVGPIEIVVIGCSTGGPAALRTLLADVRSDLKVPVCIVQHIPPGFSKPLAQRLNENCGLRVNEAFDGVVMRAAHAYLAPGGHHLLITGTMAEPVLKLDDGELEHGCRPAIDVTLRSALNVYGARVMVVILTGMGRDGAAGADAIRRRGGKVLVQSPVSSTVSSMPRQTLETAGADAVGELGELARLINESVR